MDKEEANHIKVLRIKNGETFTVCDGNGTDYICQLGENDNDGNMTAKVIDTVPSFRRSICSLCCLCSFSQRRQS